MKNTVLFDGDCGICSRFADRIEKIDSSHKFDIVSFRSLSDDRLKKYGLNYQICNEKIYLIKENGKILGGVHCINRFFLEFYPYKIFVVILYLIPIFLILEMILYRIVAKNRSTISRHLGMNVCKK